MQYRSTLLRGYLFILATFTLFWWPLSHWFYPDWYHRLLGFDSYDYALVTIIGTIGFVPVANMFLLALAPLQNRHMALSLLLFFPLLAVTYLYLILLHDFPLAELFNVALLLLNTVLLAWLYPWHIRKRINAETKRHSGGITAN